MVGVLSSEIGSAVDKGLSWNFFHFKGFSWSFCDSSQFGGINPCLRDSNASHRHIPLLFPLQPTGFGAFRSRSQNLPCGVNKHNLFSCPQDLLILGAVRKDSSEGSAALRHLSGFCPDTLWNQCHSSEVPKWPKHKDWKILESVSSQKQLHDLVSAVWQSGGKEGVRLNPHT